MRIYTDCYELMSEMGRDLWEMGSIVTPKSYQNKNIEGNDDFITKELICKQYCLTSMEEVTCLFAYDQRSVEWTKAELAERLNETGWPINPGKAWELRKDLWEQFLVTRHLAKKFDYSYNERIWWMSPTQRDGNLRLIIDELKRNPDTRQAVLMMHHPSDTQYIGGKNRVPCSMYYNFMVRTINGEKQVNIVYHQRSADFVSHFGNDVYLAWMLMEYVAAELQVKPGYLYHTIDSLHAYKKDWDKLKTPIHTHLINNANSSK